MDTNGADIVGERISDPIQFVGTVFPELIKSALVRKRRESVSLQRDESIAQLRRNGV